MNDLITVNDDIALLDKETSARIADFERRIKEIKQAEDELRQAILEEMESKGIKKLETEEMTITYKAGYDKEKFDKKTFRKENPKLCAIYDKYCSISPVKASVTIKLKEESE